MRKIIVPTDFSANAMNALRFATELFKYERVQIHIVHAFGAKIYEGDVYYTKPVFLEIKNNIERESLKQLEIIKNSIKEFSPNPRHVYTTSAEDGILIDVLDDLADDEEVDLVVMGTRGKTNDRKLTYGSNTLQVIKYIKPPVLTIPEDFIYTQPRDILFVTDFMLPYKRRELKLLNILAKSYRGKINLLYLTEFDELSPRQEDNKSFLEACLEDNVIALYKIKGTSIPEITKSFIKEHETDLLVMINSRHSYMESLIYNSVIDTIELHVKIPFLVMQNINRS